METPKFTIVYNSVSEDGYIGVCWEFFTNEHKAQARYNELNSKPERYCATKRPYYHDTDKHHLGAGHWELKNSPNIFDKKTIDTETPIAKLRNQLSPYYSLPDMILNMDVKPEIKSLLIEQAKIAKGTNDRIKELLIEIENWKEGYKVETLSIEHKSILDAFFDSPNDIEIALRTSITMHDYDNWKNGDYLGKMHEVVPHLLKTIKQHIVDFSEYLHKHYPNIIKPKNYLEVPIPRGERKWMRALFADDVEEKTSEQIYDEFLNYLKNKK